MELENLIKKRDKEYYFKIKNISRQLLFMYIFYKSVSILILFYNQISNVITYYKFVFANRIK